MGVPSFATLIDLLEGCRDVDPRRGIRLVSSRFRETFHPWAEIFRRVHHHADRLRRNGIHPGEKVVISLSTDIDTICAFLALIWLGAVPVSISGRMTGQDRGAYVRQVASLMMRFSLDRLLVDHDLFSSITQSADLDAVRTVLLHPDGFDPDRRTSWVDPARVREDDVALIQFSSGATGSPKGVRITQRNICNNLRLIVENDGRSKNSSGTIWIPLYHDMGLVGGFLSTMVHRHGFVLMSPVCFLMKPVVWLEYMSRHRGTTSVVPNFALDMCNTRIRDHQLASRNLDLGAMEYVYVGSDTVRAVTLETFYERFAPHGVRRGVLHPVYGMAETTLMVTAPGPEEDIVTRDIDGIRAVSVGRSVGDFRIRVVDERERPLPAGRVGELVVNGSSLSPGYFRDEGENQRRFRNGWFLTGDLGLVDENERVFVTGRKNDRIVVGGRNFYAHDIAEKIEALPFVKKGRTHVFSHGINGREQIVVMTVPEENMTSIASRGGDLRRFLGSPAGSWLRERLGAEKDRDVREISARNRDLLKEALKRHLLSEFGLPIHDVLFVPRIPRTPSGKIKRDECEALYREYLEEDFAEAARGARVRSSD